tara:strand:- start:45 stop:269 length:225 start_codon:yes stop_codon:yes gene_type:complete
LSIQAYFHADLLIQLKALNNSEIIPRKGKYVVKIQHFVLLIKIVDFLKKYRPYLYIKAMFIINNKQKQIKEKYD